jgi:hypothetical protein
MSDTFCASQLAGESGKSGTDSLTDKLHSPASQFPSGMASSRKRSLDNPALQTAGFVFSGYRLHIRRTKRTGDEAT